MSLQNKWKYWCFIALREWKTAGLLILLGALFFGLFQILSSGIWNARANPESLLVGKVLYAKADPALDGSFNPSVSIRIELENGEIIALRVKSRSIATCKLGDQIRVRVFTSDSNRTFYRLAPQNCRKGNG